MSKPTKRELAHLYYDEGLTQIDIAEQLGVSNNTVHRWMKDYGISPGKGTKQDITIQRLRNTHPNFYLDSSGYEYVQTTHNYKNTGCRVHQLLAIADGANPYKIFSNGELEVHHKNGLQWDNRPENLEVMSKSDHAREHSDTVPWLDALKVRKMYSTTGASQGVVGEQFGIDGSTVSRIVNGKHVHTEAHL